MLIFDFLPSWNVTVKKLHLFTRQFLFEASVWIKVKVERTRSKVHGCTESGGYRGLWISRIYLLARQILHWRTKSRNRILFNAAFPLEHLNRINRDQIYFIQYESYRSHKHRPHLLQWCLRTKKSKSLLHSSHFSISGLHCGCCKKTGESGPL